MKSRAIQLHYQFGAGSGPARQGDAEVDNPLFDPVFRPSKSRAPTGPTAHDL